MKQRISAAVASGRRRLDMSLSRTVYGNLAGFSNNLATLRELGVRRAVRMLSASGEAATDIGARLGRNGFHILDQPCAASTTAAIAAKFRDAIEDDDRSVPRASASARHKGLYSSRILRDYRILLPELHGAFDETLLDAMAAYYGGKFELHGIIAWRNYSPPNVADGVEFFSDRWHCDRIPGTIMTCFVLLGDVDENQGPLHMTSRRRTRELIQSGFGTRESYGVPIETIEDPAHVVKLTGPAGTRGLLNTSQCLHRAGHPAAGRVRDILHIQFRPSDRPFDRRQIERISPLDVERIYPRGARTADADMM